MKTKYKIIIGIIFFGTISIFSIRLFAPNFNLINMNYSIKLFSKDNIRRQFFDKEWDFEKVSNYNNSGYDLWIVGEDAQEVSAAKIASGETVSPIFFSEKELNVDYKSEEDYYSNKGPERFREFIKKYYDKR